MKIASKTGSGAKYSGLCGEDWGRNGSAAKYSGLCGEDRPENGLWRQEFELVR